MNKLEEKAKETEKQMSHLSKMISAYQKMEERQNKMSDEFPSYIR
jgi:proteasome assembly chaperone (PAC2) family protein